MKNIKYIIMSSVITLGLASCDLDRLPETTLSDTSFWKTETDLSGACAYMYQQLQGFSHDTRSDELVKTYSDNISNGSREVPSTDSNWSGAYDRIFTANNILAKGANADVDESVKNKYLAQARFFRAYNYFNLVKLYGDVPLILQPIESTTDPVLFSARTPRADVISQCYEDLDFAAKWLPNIDNVVWGHVSSSAALALKERIALYEGTYMKYHHVSGDYKTHLKLAIDAAEAIINSGKHALYPDFQKLFLFEGEGRQNKENIFVKVYGPNGAGTVVHGNSRQLENNVSLTRQIVDKFIYTDGLPREKSPLKISPETSFNDIFTNRDPRLAMTLYKAGEEAYKGELDPMANQHGYGYSIKKGFLLSEWSTNSKETIDKMLIRYAEVLISYAEALYEYNGGITDTQLDQTVNALRKRAGLNVKLTNDFAKTKGLDMLEEIRRERTVEFVDENMRYDDIIRWKTAEKVLPTDMLGCKYVESETSVARTNIANRLTDASGKVNGVYVYDEPDVYVIEFAGDRRFDPAKDYLYPVPLNEISLSGGVVTQNPGW
jgi:hypothetical protein